MQGRRVSERKKQHMYVKAKDDQPFPGHMIGSRDFPLLFAISSSPHLSPMEPIVLYIEGPLIKGEIKKNQDNYARTINK